MNRGCIRGVIRTSSLLVLVLSLSACFTVRHSYQGDKILTGDPDIPGMRATKVRHFTAHDRQFFWLHGGVPVGEPLNGAALAAREVGTHDGVVNLRIWEGQDIQDSAVTHIVCLLSMACGSWSVWVEGDVVDLEEIGG